LAAPTSWFRFESESRPALRLRAGEERRWRVRLEPGTRLVFALGFPESAPGFVHLEVEAGGRPAFAARLSAQRSGHWFHRQATLDLSGEVDLVFRTRHAAAGGKPLAGDAGAAPWIALAPPRLYRPRRGPGRVFVWISQDTVRADHLGAYGYARATSPRFDGLARESVLFEQASASSSWTLPSLASQFTARHPSYHGAVLHNLMPDERAPRLFELLAQAGFTVLGVTGNDLVSPAQGTASGLDALWFDEGRAARLSARLLAALDEWGGGDLALFVHYMDPHATYVPPPPFDRAFGAPLDPEPDTHFQLLARVRDPRQVSRVVELYDGEIAYTDSVIGDLLDELRRRGLLERAVVAYTADHGEEFLDHGGWHHGSNLYEESLRVPFALRIPGVAGRRVREPVSLVDFAPSVLDALGLAAPPSFQGRSLLALARGGAAHREPVVAETRLNTGHPELVALRQGPRKLILLVPPGRAPNFPVLHEELYQLDDDPGERHNRAGPSEESLRKAGLAYLRRARAERGEPRAASLDPETLERLKALGYVQ